CGATTPGASPAPAWKAASATRKARKAAGRRLRSNQLLVRAVAERLVAAVLAAAQRSEEHTSELQSLRQLVCRLLLEKKNPQPQGERVRQRPASRAARRYVHRQQVHVAALAVLPHAGVEGILFGCGVTGPLGRRHDPA